MYRAILLAVSLLAPHICSAQVANPARETADPTEVVIKAYPPHCHPAPGDPQDTADLSTAGGSAEQQIIRIDPVSGKYVLTQDDYPTTAPGVWQRDGTRLREFVFRVPKDGNPLCIGTRGPHSLGLAQLRQAIDAHPYRRKILRFTAWIATRKVHAVKLWLVAGTNERPKFFNIVASSGNWKDPVVGSKAWFPVSLTIGLLPCNADQISFGVTLDGGGDVWMYQPNLETVDPRSLKGDDRKQRDKAAATLRDHDPAGGCGL